MLNIQPKSRQFRMVVPLGLVFFGLSLFFIPRVFGDEIALVRDGKAKVVIVGSSRVMAEDKDISKEKNTDILTAENLRRRLRESIKDLARCLGIMGGAPVEVITNDQPIPPGNIPVFIGEIAEEKFGKVGKTAPGKQAFRYLVTKDGMGLYGESDLASSYSIYEMLDRLGCRWYMPGELGEVIPAGRSISLETADFTSAPGTLFRGIWLADDAYRRRNRLNSSTDPTMLATQHALEKYISKEQREEHPDWVAIVKGVPSPFRLKWSSIGVADAIAQRIINEQAVNPRSSFSLSPEDGASFDESEADRKLDTGDFDATFQEISITDRLMVLTNRVVERVNAKYPDLLFGLLAYVQYTRPPLRERPHPNLVPQIAPISYDRAHPITDIEAPTNKELLALIEGWAKVSPRISYYPYAYFLGELSAPYPLIRKWSVDLPIFYENNCAFWQPETTSNFETTLHGLNLGNRLAWDPRQKPADIIKDLNEGFYGHAAKEMTDYWNYVDDVWTGTPEYTGGDFGFLMRFTPTVLKKARELMDAGVSACQTPVESARVELANASLRQFELYMKMRRDYATGNFDSIAMENAHYRKTALELAEKYRENFAFSATKWAKTTHALVMHDDFKTWSYDDATRIATEYDILTPRPITFKYQPDREDEGKEAGWASPDFDDASWKETDPGVETWATLGLYNHFGTVWYRTAIDLPAVPSGKKVFLWLGGTDGSAEVYINGKQIEYFDPKTNQPKTFSGFCRPVSFDITGAILAGKPNQIAIRCDRNFLNEIGTGGLLGPVVVYREK